MTILFDATRPVKPARPFAAGLAAASELTESEARAVSEARARTARDARHAGQPAERVEAIAEDAARTAAACVMTLRGSVAHTPACESWWAAECARLADEREARELSARWHDGYATDAVCYGLIPPDTAEAIARTSLVGHDA